MSRELIFTVDLDRDVNIPITGCSAAGSMDRGQGTEPRFSSADLGLAVLLDVLDAVGVKGTFFVEGRTSETIDCSGLSGHCVGFHGYDHEDLSGQSTGVMYTRDEVESILRRGFDSVSDNISRPTCFRAPYMVRNGHVESFLPELGVFHDSSSYGDLGAEPFDLGNGVMEHPVPKTTDGSGRSMAAYLWPMHEGKRPPSDYVAMASRMEHGQLILATHTWHMVEWRERGMMGPDEVHRNADHVVEVLSGILDLGYQPTMLVG